MFLILVSLITLKQMKNLSVLALLDLSAAFDTLDHAILLKRIELPMSPPSSLRYGVPQGSVLGPVLFTLHSQSLSDVIVSHHCDYVTFVFIDEVFGVCVCV